MNISNDPIRPYNTAFKPSSITSCSNQRETSATQRFQKPLGGIANGSFTICHTNSHLAATGWCPIAADSNHGVRRKCYDSPQRKWLTIGITTWIVGKWSAMAMIRIGRMTATTVALGSISWTPTIRSVARNKQLTTCRGCRFFSLLADWFAKASK